MSEIIIDKNAKQITFTNNGIGFSQFGIANEVLDLIENQIKEIERLNKKIEQYENPEDMTLMFMWCDEKAKDEIKRLNNIIKDLEKYIRSNEWGIDYEHSNCRTHLLDILKGSDKE